MKLTIFTYERNLDIPGEIQYIDRQMIKEQGLNSILDQIKEFEPDLIIEREFNDGIAKYSDVYKHLPYLKAYWAIDCHITLAEHINYAKQFDVVFLAQSWFIPLFESQVKGHCFYLPLCHTQTLTDLNKYLSESTPISPDVQVRDIPLSFVGNIRTLHPEREQYVMRLKELMGDDFLACQADYEQTLRLLRRSQATFNCSLNNDLNFRVWEALAMGTPIYTDDVTDIDKITGLREQLDVYPKLNPPLSSFATVEEGDLIYPIVNNSISFIKSAHTLTHRYLQLIEMVKTGEQYEY